MSWVLAKGEKTHEQARHVRKNENLWASAKKKELKENKEGYKQNCRDERKSGVVKCQSSVRVQMGMCEDG